LRGIDDVSALKGRLVVLDAAAMAEQAEEEERRLW
jgi:hypothetical protein